MVKALSSPREESPISSDKTMHVLASVFMCMNFITVQHNAGLSFYFLLNQYLLFSYRKENYIYMCSQIDSWASQKHSTEVKISFADDFL